jgi:hypothetical protein
MHLGTRQIEPFGNFANSLGRNATERVLHLMQDGQQRTRQVLAG